MAPAGGVACPQCGHVNAGNRFCASCGYNLGALAGAAPSVPAAAAAAPVPGGAGIILTALRADGSEAGTFRMPDAPVVSVGRDTGSIFAGDSYLSPRHATFSKRNGQLFIKDEGSLNGVYLKVRPNEPCLLEFNDVFRIGQEIIRFEELKGQGKSADGGQGKSADGVERFGSPRQRLHRPPGAGDRSRHDRQLVPGSRARRCTAGRERGDILFSEDGYVSGLHCRIARGPDGRVYLTDVGSSNGTFVRLRAERAVGGTDILLMGQQLFRIDA